MDRHYAMKLLREAMRHPRRLVTREKFWKVDLFAHYLERCDELLFREPHKGLAFVRQGPAYALKIAEANPDASAPDFQLRAYAHLGSAYRAVAEYDKAEQAFEEASKHEGRSSGPAIADYYRRLAYLRIFQHRPECFALIEEGLALHRRGNLVDRHELGRAFICRGHAYYEFEEYGKSLDDWTAALNHLSLRKGPRPYYAALHNLAERAASHGTREDLEVSQQNLKPALSILSSYHRRHYAKYKLRWLTAVIDARLDYDGAAEEAFLEVKAGMVRLKLPHEVGAVLMDLASLYRKHGRYDRIKPLAEEAAEVFRKLGVESKAQEALDLLREANAEEITEDFLKRIRSVFLSCAEPMPSMAS